MRFPWRVVALVAAVVVVGACTSASDVDRLARLDPTACEIDPHEEYDIPVPDVGWWMADPASWVLADAVRVIEPDDVDLTAEEREAVDAWKRSGRSVTPFVVDEVRGEVLRGGSVGRFIAEPNLAAGLVRHTGQGRQVLIGTGDSMFGHQAIAFLDDGRLEFLGFCMEHWRGPHVARVIEQLQMEPPDLSLRVTPQELLLTLISEPEGRLGAAVERIVHGRAPEPVPWDELDPYNRHVDPEAIGRSPYVADQLRTLNVVITTTVRDELTDGPDWVLCPHPGPGWATCIAWGAIEMNQPGAAIPMYAPAAGGPLVLWLIDNRTWPDPDRHLLAIIEVEPSTIWAYVDIGGTTIAGVLADPSSAVTVRLSDRFERER
jgi:hypothetical protein